MGLFAVVVAAGPKLRTASISAFSVGVFLWYFSDTIGDSSYLGVNEGLSGGVGHLALPLLFAAGLAFFLAIDKGGTRPKIESHDLVRASVPYVLAALPITIALSVHGFGEGLAFGAVASSTASTSIVLAFGGYGPVFSYILHKVLEASMVGTGYLICCGSQCERGSAGRYRDLLLLGLIFTAPTLLGAALSDYAPFDATFVFAIATGASVYAILRLAAPIFKQGTGGYHAESVKLGFIVLFGFLLIYTAALFHSFPVF